MLSRVGYGLIVGEGCLSVALRRVVAVLCEGPFGATAG